MNEATGFERARGVLHSDEPSTCPDCGAELSNGTEQIHHLWRVGCVEVLKAQIADLERQLEEARKRIGWWGDLWEIARNGDPQLDFLYEKFAREEG